MCYNYVELILLLTWAHLVTGKLCNYVTSRQGHSLLAQTERGDTQSSDRDWRVQRWKRWRLLWLWCWGHSGGMRERASWLIFSVIKWMWSVGKWEESRYTTQPCDSPEYQSPIRSWIIKIMSSWSPGSPQSTLETQDVLVYLLWTFWTKTFFEYIV